ncbi:efflux RND transporter periplasmic adaptor subunit [Vibrio sp. SM6]|uniref:Efflux RND transporter periplasmic adaptor subunit n=1 Tax=Vibrio agarilyticus TaxID=2726741 RepID=A0A7X8YH25_9VIBR|nr:efflux RND transporter periplasmic adaptor subunit [Vibrio agarilyticus]NLS13299.1 efflux RND transporter periplasmic adaptor subunit [Vibrio agarilyticus]
MKRSSMVLALLSVSVIVGCKPNAPTTNEAPLYVSTFDVGEPVKNQFRQFKGQVVPAEQTELAFRRAGEVLHVLVKTGDNVKKGQLLAKLDDATAQQAFNDTQAQFDLALKQYQRGEELFKREMISSAERDRLYANQKLAKAQFELAKNQLAYTRLVAPFDGAVSEVFTERFETVAVGEPVVNLYKDESLYVEIELSDNVLTMINPESARAPYRPMVSFSGHTEQYQMQYLEHSSEPSAQSGSYLMWLAMPQIQPQVLPGTSASITVDMVAAGISAIEGYQVPMSVLQAGDEPGQFYVWKLEDSLPNRVEVAISQINGHGAVVHRGVSQGDQLIRSNLRKLRAGTPVKLVEKNNG